MASMDMGHRPTSEQRRRADDRAYRLIFCLVYPLFLAVAVLSRLAPASRPGGPARRSVFAEARTAAASSIPFAFR